MGLEDGSVGMGTGWQPQGAQFKPLNSRVRKELTSVSCLLTSTRELWLMCTHILTHTLK